MGHGLIVVGVSEGYYTLSTLMSVNYSPCKK